ncbi:hypothetical protein BH11BAC4_BH11BAC4_12880 [soil metagenome]
MKQKIGRITDQHLPGRKLSLLVNISGIIVVAVIAMLIGLWIHEKV